LKLNPAGVGKKSKKGDQIGSSPPAEVITNVDLEDEISDVVNDQTCLEENTNFAGSGIKDNKIDEIFSPVDCQKKC
jgi:hypothetical protein